MVDKVLQGKTRTRRVYCSYYTESDPILTYMVKQLGVVQNDSVLEPCAGDGVFVRKMHEMHSKDRVKMELVDLNPDAVINLTKLFGKYKNIIVRKADTLLDSTFDLVANSGGKYTKIIGNPPYGAWIEYQKRSDFKKIYKDYSRESYTLFLRRCVDLLKENGKLVFIIPDTFLAINLHKNLRKKLLQETAIEELLLIPSRFFPGVNFGYSNLCIITLIKKNTTA